MKPLSIFSLGEKSVNVGEKNSCGEVIKVLDLWAPPTVDVTCVTVMRRGKKHVAVYMSPHLSSPNIVKTCGWLGLRL